MFRRLKGQAEDAAMSFSPASLSDQREIRYHWPHHQGDSSALAHLSHPIAYYIVGGDRPDPVQRGKRIHVSQFLFG
jgi:hypothetical protein